MVTIRADSAGSHQALLLSVFCTLPSLLSIDLSTCLVLQAPAAAAPVKETPQERLKRLMQAQLNKAAQKDSLANAQKKIQLEKEKVARQQLERVAMAAGRGRGRSPSSDGYDDRDRSP
eukprot:GHUV01042338.1.p1 GENE.GHUV01042338.1~~GHUV01042338.1.p1  ORF type:complete len:118 (+),score=32.47 GHUV01042338.1:272-625(+)